MSEEPLRLCPICDLLHGHEVTLTVQEKRPQVSCPCAKCRVEGRDWDTHEEYEHWVEKTMPTILAYAEEARALIAEGKEPPDTAHKDNVDELCDYRRWEIDKKKEKGSWEPKSAWGKSGPPD